MLLERIQLKNLLSFGPQAEELELRPLNVLIGTNGSGKSNLIEAIGLLQATSTDMAAPIRAGGVADWIWQGDPKADSARVEAIVHTTGQEPLRYSVEFAELQRRFVVVDERLESAALPQDDVPYVEVVGPDGHALLRTKANELSGDKLWGVFERVKYPLDLSKSVLAQVRDLEHYSELTRLAKELERIRLYREWTFGRNNVVRSLQKTDQPNANLNEDNANLGLVLNRLSRDYKVRERMVEALRGLYQEVSDFHVNVEFNTVQVFVQEQGGKVTVPATRLSDGTIRYLSLLAILCDPDPPPLVCIEEPELGLHPDILPGLAELLLEASERCQLIVTTHSEVLVDALTHHPECVVVCEKEEGQTQLRRLSALDLKHWLDKYRLGELWSSGEIGGNRW